MNVNVSSRRDSPKGKREVVQYNAGVEIKLMMEEVSQLLGTAFVQ